MDQVIHLILISTVHRPYRGQPYRGHFVIFRKKLHRPYRGHFKNDQLSDCFVSYGNVPALLDFKSSLISHIYVTSMMYRYNNLSRNALFDRKKRSPSSIFKTYERKIHNLLLVVQEKVEVNKQEKCALV